jgi:hypothetical protein
VGFRPFYVNGPPYGGFDGDVHDAARFLSLHLGDGTPTAIGCCQPSPPPRWAPSPPTDPASSPDSAGGGGTRQTTAADWSSTFQIAMGIRIAYLFVYVYFLVHFARDNSAVSLFYARLFWMGLMLTF